MLSRLYRRVRDRPHPGPRGLDGDHVSRAAAQKANDLGELEATYSVVREIGRGGMGAVVLARHRIAGHQVAIKIASADKFDADALARFSREARLMARFQHPNIVRLFDVHHLGETGRVAIVMEYVRGTSLASILARGRRLSFGTIARILRDLGKALAHAHGQGVVHRDVKPHNVLVEESSGRAMLSDFGIAKAASDDEDVTAVGATVGTPAYMSPEQIDGRSIDHRSDIYGLGTLGWEMISGERPWAGEPLFKLLFRQKHDALPALTLLRPDTPHCLLLALEGALEKAPEDRWDSVMDFVEQVSFDEPTAAMLARRAHVAARRLSTVGSVSVESSTVPLPRPVAVPERPDAVDAPVDGATLPDVRAHAVARDDRARPRGPATSQALRERPRVRRRQVALFGLGLAAGGLLMFAAGSLLTRVRANRPEPTPPNALVQPQRPLSAAAKAIPRRDAPGRAPVISAAGDVAREPVSGPAATESAPGSLRAVAFNAAPTPAPAMKFVEATPPSLDRRAAAFALATRARELVFSDQVERAIRVADSALAMDRRNGVAYVVRARALIRRNDVRNAWTNIELGERSGARWEALPLATLLRARELGPAAARVQLQPEVRAALTPRRTLDSGRAVALAAALVQVGDQPTALAVLEQAAADERFRVLLGDPLFAPLWASDRFRRLPRQAVR